MQSKDPGLITSRNYFEKRMARSCRIVPLVISDLVTTQKTNRVISSRCPERKLRGDGQPFDNVRIYRFLKNDQIRRGRNNRLRQCLLPTATTKTDVVAQ
jgi:hypothetical protein